MSRATSVELRDDRGVFGDLAAWWNDCPGPAGTPFLRSEWFDLWSRAFLQEGSKLEVVVWTVDGTPTAVLPLATRGIRHLSLANSHSDVFDLIAMPDSGAATVAMDWLRHRPVTRLFRLDGHSALLPSEPDRSWLVDRRSEAPYVDLPDDPADVERRLSRNLVKQIRRLERRLAETAEITYLDNADGVVPDILEKCFRLEAMGGKGREGTAMSSRPDSDRFYRSLVEVARERGWLRICALMVDDRVGAFELDLDYAGRRFSLKAGYDEYLSRHSPGKVLQLRVLEAASSLGLTSYEFGGVAEQWKLQWAKTTRPRLNALSFGTRGIGRVAGAGARLIASRRPMESNDDDPAEN